MPGQPRNTDLRRAVSAAYYALFHHLTMEAAEALLPTATQEEKWRLARHFEHAGIRRVCDWVVGPKSPGPRYRDLCLPLRDNATLRDVAIAFQTLQVARMDADYNHEFSLTRPATWNLIDTAVDAIGKVDSLVGAKSNALQLFLLLLAIAPR